MGQVNRSQNNSRVLHLIGAPNFRDLGGYVTADGREVKWRMLFRSDELTGLTESDLTVLAGLGLNRIIDLRHELEIRQSGFDSIYDGNESRFDFLEYVFGDPYLMESQSDAQLDWDVRRVDFRSLYINILECNREGIRQAFERLADPAQYPMVVHCTQGKDRSGVISALVLLLLGVPEPTVFEDYLLTDDLIDTEKGFQSMEAYIEAFRHVVPEGVTVEDWRPMLTCVPEAMESLLNHLKAKFAGVEGYLESIGVSSAQHQSIRDTLLGDEVR